MIRRRPSYYVLWALPGVALVLLLTKCGMTAPDYDKTVCAGPPLRTTAARNDAMENGYPINQRYDCIDKALYEDMLRREAVAKEEHQKATAERARAAAAEVALTLAQARRGFQTAIAAPAQEGRPLPQPPANLFVRSDYASTNNLVLPAFITPNPKDGRKHPAIIWLTGGDTNSLDDFWTPGPPSNDQSASAFRKAGVVMMFPTLRGGNQNKGHREFFLGEVDDVLSAAEHLARLPYVDPARIYLGGHSTGATLALLTAQTSGRFSAVLAFGPVSQVERYGPSLVPVNFNLFDAKERKLRSPIHWMHTIAGPTFIIEGAQGNSEDLAELCGKSTSPLLRCIAVDGANHFSVLDRVSRTAAARIATAASGADFSLSVEEFQKKGNSPTE